LLENEFLNSQVASIYMRTMKEKIPVFVESLNGHDTKEIEKEKVKDEVQKQLESGKWVSIEKKDGSSEILTEKDLPKVVSEDEEWIKKFEGVKSITATNKVKGG